MSGTILQLRIGATRERGFLFRTCVRPPSTVTIGRAIGAVLPVDDPAAPDEHPLFSIGENGCLVDCRADWPLVMYRDDGAVDGATLLAEGTAVQSGRRVLMRMAPGSRGAVQIGGVRLLFKWEVVPDDPIGEVPLQDLGHVPRCHACGLAMRDALPRDGLLSRCDACRALNRFVDPDARYRTKTLSRQDALAPFVQGPGRPDPASSQKIPAVSEEGDTLLAVPIFAPLTTHALPVLPQHAQPAGRPGQMETPAELRVAKNPAVAIEQMQTVLSRSPFVRRGAVSTREVAPTPTEPDALEEPEEIGDASSWRSPAVSAARADALDDAFYTAEVEALGLPQATTLDGIDANDPPVAWSTMSVLSARSEYEAAEGRIPRRDVARAVQEAEEDPESWLHANGALLAAFTGLAMLVLGLGLVIGSGDRPAPAPVASAPGAAASSPAAPAVGGWIAEPLGVLHDTATYVKFLPGDPTPISVRVPAFRIDRTEVTMRQFERFLAATGSRPPTTWLDDRPEAGTERPVTGVTTDEARRYCRWVQGRLPTEAEWERAGAGTYGRMYPWGNSFESRHVAIAARPDVVGSHPDGASESGVLDLIGNAIEWVEPADGEAPFLKGGGAGAWSGRPFLMLFGRVPADAAPWRPGPGFRCAYAP